MDAQTMVFNNEAIDRCPLNKFGLPFGMYKRNEGPNLIKNAINFPIFDGVGEKCQNDDDFDLSNACPSHLEPPLQEDFDSMCENFDPVKNSAYDGVELCSHNSTAILDGEKVFFRPNDPVDDDNEEENIEADMVYYHKDDLTNYSKFMKLNRVRVKKRGLDDSDLDV
jgi:uncharacterized protein YacL (UPF0231 family)